MADTLLVFSKHTEANAGVLEFHHIFHRTK